MKRPNYFQMPTDWSNANAAVIEAAQKILKLIKEYVFCNDFRSETTREDMKSRLLSSISTAYLKKESKIQGVKNAVENFINSSKVLEYMENYDDGSSKYGCAVKLDSDFMTGEMSSLLGCIKVQFMLLKFKEDEFVVDTESPQIIVEEGKLYFAADNSSTKTMKFEVLPVFENFVQLNLNGSDTPVDRY